MAQSRLRQALPSLTALRHSLPLKPSSISSSLSSQQQQHTCSFPTRLFQSRACATFPLTPEEYKKNGEIIDQICKFISRVPENKEKNKKYVDDEETIGRLSTIFARAFKKEAEKRIKRLSGSFRYTFCPPMERLRRLVVK